MKSITGIFAVLLIIILAISCGQETNSSDMDIIFLHHSTGRNIYDGGNHPSRFARLAGRLSPRLERDFHSSARLKQLFKEYNKENNTNYSIREENFPKPEPYGWNNYPYDYYNIWVKNAGEEPYMEEPTLEMLTKEYQVIMFKHCYPVCNIQADLDTTDINSDIMTLSNYKAQYLAIRDKLHEFPDNKFILWTGAALIKHYLPEDQALRAQEFFNWVINEWDLPEDNIYIWDLYGHQTEGGLYFKDEYARSSEDAHPNDEFTGRVVNDLFSRIIDVVENNGNGTQLSGKEINN